MDYELEPWSGLEKISESVRAYAYLILTSQAAARHGILGEQAASLAAQRIFYDNLEDVINKAVSLEDDIGRYQSVLKYARSKLNYSIGKGLYMLPSDMLLRPLNQVIEGYNDKIVVNTGGLELGKVVLHKPAAAPSGAAGDPAKPRLELSREGGGGALGRLKNPPTPNGVTRRVHTLDDHRDEVLALTLGIGGLALFAIWYL